MIISCLASSADELSQIIALQQQNLKQNISEAELKEQGFLTLAHPPETLQLFHTLAPSVIIKDDDQVVAYALTVVNEGRAFYPPLDAHFKKFESLNYNGKPLSDYRFYEMGQVCVAKAYRGRGLFDQLYQQHKTSYQHRYELLVTLISTSNHRSLRAHQRVGFQTIHQYTDEMDTWDVVAWDWS